MDATRIAWKAGWDDAAVYVQGTRADRRRIRQRVRKAHDRDSKVRADYLDIFVRRIEDFAAAIREGRLPRTIAPSKLHYLANGHGMT